MKKRLLLIVPSVIILLLVIMNPSKKNFDEAVLGLIDATPYEFKAYHTTSQDHNWLIFSNYTVKRMNNAGKVIQIKKYLGIAGGFYRTNDPEPSNNPKRVLQDSAPEALFNKKEEVHIDFVPENK